LAYARQGLSIPCDTDPYCVPGFEGHRGGLKAGLNALLFTNGTLKRWPQDIASSLPRGWPVARVKDAIVQHLPGLKACLEAGGGVEGAEQVPIGFHLMFTESEILMDALKDLMALGVVALPMHDAVLAAEADAMVAKRCLEASALRIAGVEIPVAIKQAVGME
jgi:hypothetical protein